MSTQTHPEGTSGERVVSALSVTALSKSFAGNQALSGLNLQVAAGEIRALVGGNGSGKSTFIKILSGYHVPDPGGVAEIGGEILTFGHPKISYRLGARFVHQDLGLIDGGSVGDNLFLSSGYPTRLGRVSTKRSRIMAEQALAHIGLHVDPKKLVGELSAAEKTGVAIARALVGSESSPLRLLVLDEPTATLPLVEVEMLHQMVRSVAEGGVGVVYVTHRLDEVFQLASTVTVLRNGREIRSTSVQDYDRARLLNEIAGEEVLEVHRASSDSRIPTTTAVLAVKGVRAGLLRYLSFEVYSGEILGLAGVTGSGRESVNGSIFGALSRSGVVTIDGREVPPDQPDASVASGIGFLPSDRRAHGGMMDLSATENLTIGSIPEFWQAPLMRRRSERSEAKRWFERLDVRPVEAYEAPLGSFSGGNQQKILLGKWLRLDPKVLLLEEPTQGVDLSATAEIYRQLLQSAREGCALVVSSANDDELVALCSRVLVISEGRISAVLTGRDVTVANITRASLSGQHPRVLEEVV